MTQKTDLYGVEVGTELDIATAIVYLQARAKRFGKSGIPIEVQLSPLSPAEGWVRAAKRFIEERKKEAQQGKGFDAKLDVPDAGGGVMESVNG